MNLLVPAPDARQLAELSLAFEDTAARIRLGAEGAGLTLSEVRLLSGLARGETGARNLSRRMRLDEGHVSRMVKRLRGTGLIAAERQQGDGRRVILTLTPAGQARLDLAMQGAEAAAAAALADGSAAEFPGLTPVTPAPEPVELTAPGPGDLGWVIAQHGLLYARDEGFGPDFEGLVARILGRFAEAHDPDRERGWIARAGDARLGCVFCMKADGAGDAAQLRLFLVLPEARRSGLGRRLLTACHDFAVGAGYTELILRTHAEHRAACALYRDFGFSLVESHPVVAWGRALHEQLWALPLGALRGA